jgi:hypothetical protein
VENCTLQISNHVTGLPYNFINTSTKWSPSEADSHSAVQEIPHLLWNLGAQYFIHNSQLLNTNMSQLNAAEIVIPHFIKINFNVNLTFMSTPPQVIFSFRFTGQSLYQTIASLVRATCVHISSHDVTSINAFLLLVYSYFGHRYQVCYSCIHFICRHTDSYFLIRCNLAMRSQRHTRRYPRKRQPLQLHRINNAST